MSNLLYNIANLAGHAKKLGSSINNAMGFYDKFAASFNMNLISKSKRLEKLGVTVKSNKQIPENLVSAAEVINKESEETAPKKNKSKEPQKLTEKEWR